MSSVWIYVDAPTHRVKVFAAQASAMEWLRNNDPDGLAVEYPLEDQPAPAYPAAKTDVQSLVEAFLHAQTILKDYLDAGAAQDYADTMTRLVHTLVDHDVLAAVGRLERRKRFALVG